MRYSLFKSDGLWIMYYDTGDDSSGIPADVLADMDAGLYIAGAGPLTPIAHGPDTPVGAGEGWCFYAALGGWVAAKADAGGWRGWTDVEIFVEAQRRKIDALENEYQPKLDSLYKQRVIVGVAMNKPTQAFADVVKAHIDQLDAALDSAVSAARREGITISELDAVAVQWPEITPANPFDPQYQEQ